MQLNHHPSPGIKGLLPGFFVLPQNPLWDNKSQSMNPLGFAGVRYIPRLAEILPSRFAVPSNPLIAQIRAGMKGVGGCGGCSGRSGGCGGCSKSGSGSNGANPMDGGTGYVNGAPIISTEFSDLFGGINWVTVAVAVAAAVAISKRK